MLHEKQGESRRRSLCSNVGKFLSIRKSFFLVLEHKQDCRGLRREVEDEEIDDIDILSNTIVVLYPSEVKILLAICFYYPICEVSFNGSVFIWLFL